MASKQGSDIPVLLRVKRKRTEEPAEALVIACKFRKLDALGDRRGSNEDQNVFHFAGTVQSQKESPEDILTRVSCRKDHSTLFKLGPFSKLTISEHQEEQREKKKSQSSQRRFKLVSQHRCLEEAKENHQKKEEEEKQLSAKAQTGKMNDTLSGKDDDREMVCLYDLEEDEGEEECKDLSGGIHDLAHAGERSSVITCNSSPMIRQSVPVSDSDFVYDVYFTHTRSKADMSHYNWSLISAYSYDQDLVHDSQYSEEECCDEEDDSNDEDNWRNDYPDELSDEEEDSDVDSLDRGYRGKDSYRGENEEDCFLDGKYWDNRD